MNVPDNFLMDDQAEIHGLMRANPFAVLVSHSEEGWAGGDTPANCVKTERQPAWHS